LGGHSLLATRVISRVRETFQLEIPLRALFDAPTLSELAQQVETAIRAKQSLHVEVLEGELAYWREQLAEATTLQLPADHARSGVQTFQGAHTSLILTPDLSAELKQLSRREGATLFMTLLSAFNILLQRYTGQKDIVIGSPVAGRSKSATEGLIGSFVNVL